MSRWTRGAGGVLVALVGLTMLAMGALPTDAWAGTGGGATGTGNGYTAQKNVKIVNPPTHSSDVARRDSSQNPEWISHKDCTSGLTYRFDYTLTTAIVNGAKGASFEVWESRDSGSCAELSSRNTGTCKLLFSDDSPSDIGGSVTLKVGDDIVKKGLGQDSCDFDDSETIIPIQIWFILVRADNPTTTDVGDYTAWTPTEIDLWGPGKPDAPEVVAGDGSLTLTISPSDSDTAKFKVFRDPPPTPVVDVPTTGAGGAGGAGGSGGAGGAGGATTATGSGGSGGGTAAVCSPSDILTPGDAPSAYLLYRVADEVEYKTGAGTATSVLKDLTNNVNYRVAVAGVDTVGNLGKLSEIACGVPKPVDSFFKIYCQDGGTCAGCSFGIDADFGWPALATAAFFTLGLRARRKTRARRAARQEKVS